MGFLIAAAVLVITLFAAALIAPRPFDGLTFRFDPCALESKDWGLIDPQCADLRVDQPSWAPETRANRTSRPHPWTDHPVI